VAVHGEDVDEDEGRDGQHIEKRRQAVGEGVKQARADADRGQDETSAKPQRRSRCAEPARADHRRDEKARFVRAFSGSAQSPGPSRSQ
jgi:hypothetical protein